jgi:predicted thioesterase
MCTMRRRIVWTIVGVPLALIAVAAGTAAAFPVARHIVLALWNLPDRLLRFKVEARDEDKKVGEGTHRRAIIQVQKKD